MSKMHPLRLETRCEVDTRLMKSRLVPSESAKLQCVDAIIGGMCWVGEKISLSCHVASVRLISERPHAQRVCSDIADHRFAPTTSLGFRVKVDMLFSRGLFLLGSHAAGADNSLFQFVNFLFSYFLVFPRPFSFIFLVTCPLVFLHSTLFACCIFYFPSLSVFFCTCSSRCAYLWYISYGNGGWFPRASVTVICENQSM
ncbi:unnamed protein product [Sphacelaria rigidula]